MEVFTFLEEYRLKSILGKIRNARIGLIGDVCLDIYWEADMTRSELSRETPHFPLPVVKEWMSPGAAGNVAANQSALKPAKFEVIGVTGTEWRGRELFRCLQNAGINTDNIIKSSKRITTAYAKPLRKGISDLVYEDPRLDFGNYEPLGKDEEEQLIQTLKRAAQGLDILCVSDQFSYGCITEAVRDAIIQLGRQGLTVVVDSRDRIGLYSGLILKPNDLEAGKAVNKAAHDGAVRAAGGVTSGKAISRAIDGAADGVTGKAETARQLALKTSSRVCMTAGPEGCIYTDGKNAVHIPSHKVVGPIDICGAGDTFLSAFSCALAAGAEATEAAFFANLASEVTISKIGTTGTASPEEIIARYEAISGAV